MFPIAETGFDPQATQDFYSDTRPARDLRHALRVRLSRAAVPRVPEHRRGDARDLDGRTDVDDPRPARHLLRRRSGVQGQEARADRRRTTSIRGSGSSTRGCARRIAWFIEGKIVGARCRGRRRRRRRGKFDYDAPIEGLRAIDRYTIQLKLKEPDYMLLGYLTQTAMAAVAREVVEAYGDASGWVMANPVGTGPYRLKDGGADRRSCSRRTRTTAKSISRRSAGCRRATDAVRGQMKGKRLPQIGRIEISIIEESNPQLLAFNQRRARLRQRAADLVAQGARRNNRAAAALCERGRDAASRASRSRRCSTRTSTWRTRSSAATTPEKIALRRAIIMGFNTPRPDQGLVPGSGDARDAADAARRRGPHRRPRRPRVTYDPATARGAARQVRLQGPRRRRLPRTARRQAAHADHGVARRRAATASATSCGREA